MLETSERLNQLARLVARIPSKTIAGVDDFFHLRLCEEIDSLGKKIERVITSESLELADAHSHSELVLEAAFRGGPEAVFRGVHFLRDTHLMSGQLVQRWKSRLTDLLSQGRVNSVRRIVVKADNEDMETELTREFVKYHMVTPNHDIRTVRECTLRDAVNDSSVSIPHDFGIYGTSYVFVSSDRNPELLEGTWYRSANEIATFIRLFDGLWADALPISERILGE